MFTRHSVGTTEKLIAFVAPTRTALTIINEDTVAIIYIRHEKGVAAGNGTSIYPLSSASFQIPEDNPALSMWCIANAASTPVSVYEGFG